MFNGLTHLPSAYSEQISISVLTLLLFICLAVNNRGVKWDQIFLGVGSDEAIDMIMRIFCAPGKDAILITPPTYGMYTVCAKVKDRWRKVGNDCSASVDADVL